MFRSKVKSQNGRETCLENYTPQDAPWPPQVGSLLSSRNKMAYSQAEGESMLERNVTVILCKKSIFDLLKI